MQYNHNRLLRWQGIGEGMTSLHKLIALVIIWAAVASIAFAFYGMLFLTPISSIVVVLVTILLIGGGVAATFAIGRARSPGQ